MARQRTSNAAPPAAPLSLQSLGRAGDLGALAHYADAAYYDLTYGARRQDVDHYVRRARELGGPVLEYGAGTGRITLPLARAGLEVTGVELARPMLQACEARLARAPRHLRGRVVLHQGDMRTLRLERRYRLVIAPFNVLLHLYTRQELAELLERVKEHLLPGGRFVFDVSVPQGEDLARDPERRYPAPDVRHPETGQVLGYAERFHYDPLRQLLLVWMEFSPRDGSPPWSVPLTHRQWFPQELEAALHHAGFVDQRWSADFTGEPPDANVDSLVVDCGLAPGP